MSGDAWLSSYRAEEIVQPISCKTDFEDSDPFLQPGLAH